MVNLETAITDGGEPVAGKNYHFRSPAASFTALKAAGVDVVNMANNHALDYGPVGMQDTFAAIADGQAAGHRDRPRRGRGVPAVPHDDQGAAHRHPQRDRLARARARELVVGDRHPARRSRSRSTAPASSPRCRRCAPRSTRSWCSCTGAPRRRGARRASSRTSPTALLGAGADIVVGSHAHRVFGAGKVGPALVAYGTGQLRVLARRRRIGTQRRAAGDRHRTRGRRLLVGAGPHHQRRGGPADRATRPPPTSPNGTPAAAAAACRPSTDEFRPAARRSNLHDR